MESLWKDLSCNLKQASKAVLVQTENAGRGLVATENIQRDDVILTETPVISGPPQSIGPHFCANCSQPLTDGLLEDCLNSCGLKMCSKKCQTTHQRHDDEECALVKKVKDKSFDQWLTVLRVLRLRKSKSELWKRFNILEDHLEDRKECPIMKRNKSAVWNVLHHYLPELVEGLSCEDVMKICGILDANSFRIDKYGTRSIFLATSMVNHDCLSNARYIFDDMGHVTLKAKKSIPKGDPITINYCTVLLNTEARLAKLKSTKYFICNCSLCLDPTEKGTFMSAVICPKCKGNLLPESFSDPSYPDWQCDKCQFVTTHEKVTKLIDAVKNSYNKIISNPRTFVLEKVAELESLLKKRCGTVLPPTHQVILDLKLDLANIYDADKKLDSVNKRLEIIGERIKVLQILEGDDTDSRVKGFLLFRKHNLLVAKIANLQRKNSLNEKDTKELGGQLGISLKESARLLLHDQGCPPHLIEVMSMCMSNNLRSNT